MDTVTLWRPTGPRELAMVEASGWREWPPRLPDQPIFYPVLNEEYAIGAEDLDELNRHIVGRIQVVAKCHPVSRTDGRA